MPKKKLKYNTRNEAQIATWQPGKVVEKMYSDFDKVVAKAKKDGEMIPKFKNWFYEVYISPVHHPKKK